MQNSQGKKEYFPDRKGIKRSKKDGAREDPS